MADGLSVPLSCLLVFVAWTIALVLALTVVRLRHLRRGGSVRDFGVPDDRRLVWSTA